MSRENRQRVPRRKYLAIGAAVGSSIIAGCSDGGSTDSSENGDSETQTNENPTTEKSDETQTNDNQTSDDEDTSPPESLTVQPGDSITSAVETVAEGGTIELEDGEYEQVIEIRKSVTLRGINQPTIQSGGAPNQPAILTADPVSLTLENLGFASETQNTVDIAIQAAAGQGEADQVKLVDVSFSPNKGGIATGQAAINTLRLSGITSNSLGEANNVISGTPNTIEITESEFIGFEFDVADVETVEMSDVTFVDSQPFFDYNPNTDRDSAGTITSFSATNVETTDSAELGVTLARDGQATIKNITATAPTAQAFVATGGESISVSSSNFTGGGFTVDGTTSQVGRDRTITITGLEVLETSASGVEVSDGPGSQSVEISDSTIEAAEQRGIDVEASTISIDETTTNGNGENGVNVISDERGEITIANLVANRNGEDAVQIANASTVNLETIEVIENDELGIDIDSGSGLSHSAELIDIEVRNTGSTGIAVEGSDSAELTMRDVVISDTDWYGLYITHPRNVTLENVDVSGSAGNVSNFKLANATLDDITVTNCDFRDSVNEA